MLTPERYKEIDSEINKELSRLVSLKDEFLWLSKQGVMKEYNDDLKLYPAVIPDSDGKTFTKYERVRKELDDYLYMRDLERKGKLRMKVERDIQADKIDF